MTDCVGFLLKRGLVLASYSRTTTGVDSISTYTRCMAWSQPSTGCSC